MNGETEPETGTERMVMIGIAASAGGLEAMSLLAQNLPSGQNCAYVLAQHMSPTHKSILVELLARETRLMVQEIEDQQALEADTIYVPPPGYDVSLEDGCLRLRKPEGHPASPKPSADRLFKSIAREMKDACLGLVLSGTGSDGSYGVQAIREAGGITIAQEPGSCKYDAMPVSAIKTGCVDLVLTPQQIGKHLSMILERPRHLADLQQLNVRDHRYSDLFQILLAHTLVDFRLYKETTIGRRIQRRMLAKGITQYRDYVELCRRSVEEVEALYRDLLISVTNFFRDKESFKALANVAAEVVEAKRGDTVRVWITGCATGEEAYSIAILFAEALGGFETLDKERLQIFATDIDERALAVGRAGRYPLAALEDIPAEYVGKYFDLSDGHIVVRPRLRGCVMFTRHNVFQDAPFMSIDLVSIRNVMIYFEPKLQERVLSRLRYALNPDGVLFLGTSETIGTLEGQFSIVDVRAKIFRKRANPAAMASGQQDAGHLAWAGRRTRRGRTDEGPISPEYWQRFDALAKVVVRNGFLVTREKSIVKIYGDIAPFCRMTDPFFGGITLNILKQALAYDAGSMLLVALRHAEMRAGQWHPIEGPDFNQVRIHVYPLLSADSDEHLALIGFETEMRTEPDFAEEERTGYTEYIENELSRTRETLQVTIEQLQTSNEELQSLNEELQSANEELQATNEELETSNEELQSTNEELITVNEELLVNSDELQRASAELKGLIDGLPSVTMMLDQGLLIRHASQRAMETFHITERGNSLGHMSQCFQPKGFPSLIDLCAQAVVDRQPLRRQFVVGQTHYDLSVTPLSGDGSALLGVILHIDAVGIAAEAMLNTVTHRFGVACTWQADARSGKMFWSPEARDLLGVEPVDEPMSLERSIGFYLDEDRAQVREVLAEARQEGGEFYFTARMRRSDGHVIPVETAGGAIRNSEGEIVALVGMIRDVSEHRLRDLVQAQFDASMQAAGRGSFFWDGVTRLAYSDAGLREITGTTEVVSERLDPLLALFDPEIRARLETRLSEARQSGTAFSAVEPLREPRDGHGQCRIATEPSAVPEKSGGWLFGTVDLVNT